MDTNEILDQIDSQIAQLKEARSLLTGTTATKVKRGRPNKASVAVIAPVAAKRVLSPEARAKIAAAQKARWAKVKKAKKAA